ncbi:MAG: hypothetical protein H0T79_15415 [Deltaproteobacteria bacterium]|nr:hypothetical protein [Deltaproteobacteria bacterium]
MTTLPLFMYGMLTLGCVAIGVMFLKFWRVSRDRFFVWFAIAFWIFGAGWIIRAVVPTIKDDGHLIYAPRLLGFLMILAAIYDKNRRSRS